MADTIGEALRRLLRAVSWVGVVKLRRARAWPSSVVLFHAKEARGWAACPRCRMYERNA